MNLRWKCLGILVVCIALTPLACFGAHASPNAYQARDSFRYYGPGNLRELWDRDDWQPHRIGRDTWIFWTWGNQKFLRYGQKQLAKQAIPISLDMFRLLDSRQRDSRFKSLGLINEPNCRKAAHPDKYGFWIDEWDGDPEHYYPGDPAYDGKQHYPGTNDIVDTRNYGRPSGIIGLRLLDNPKFTAAMAKSWDARKDSRRYFESPGTIEPPYLVGFTCGFCHMGFNPLKPPGDREHPRWENLAANIGNQYFREGELILTKGRALFGDRRRGPHYADDPYDTQGLGAEDFLYHYAATQQPGTSETSRISYDFINNPNTINPIFNLGHRRTFSEVNPQGKTIQTMHILKDGADSVGVEWALMRVPINIGCEGVYWSGSLFDPFIGAGEHPFNLAEALHRLPEDEKKKLTAKYGIDFTNVTVARINSIKQRYRDDFGDQFGEDWAEAWKRNASMAAYLSSYKPFYLKDAPGGEEFLKEKDRIARGRRQFGTYCAKCHSSKQPETADARANPKFYIDSVERADFLTDNVLTDDERYPVSDPLLRTNIARAIGTNAIQGDIWAELSSRDYKSLPVTQIPLQFNAPVFEGKPAIPISFRLPAGGRGYYRTPSLVSMWATAPYFHNNSLGSYTPAVSVADRIKSFEESVDQLLWPERRPTVVKRVDHDCSLLTGAAQAIPRLLTDRLVVGLHDRLSEKTTPALADTASAELRPVIETILRTTIGDATEVSFDALQDQLPAALDDELRKYSDRLDMPRETKDALRKSLISGLRADLSVLDTMFRDRYLTIHKGTPVNLIANLSINRLPYAIAAHLQYKVGSRDWAKSLLEASDCPDLIENYGHLYGTSEMSDEGKKDLKEYLKTL
jgi:hypothetical protein